MVTVPQGCYAGSQIQVQIEGQRLTFRCWFQVSLPNGGRVIVTAPQGCYAGSQIQVKTECRTPHSSLFALGFASQRRPRDGDCSARLLRGIPNPSASARRRASAGPGPRGAAIGADGRGDAALHAARDQAVHLLQRAWHLLQRQRAPAGWLRWAGRLPFVSWPLQEIVLPRGPCPRIKPPFIAPPPTCIAHTVTILLQYYCVIFARPPRLCVIHHTILYIAISCKG